MLITRKPGSLPHEWLELSLFPFLEPVIRIEDYLDGDTYVVRAELPGIDPQKDVKVTIVNDALHLEATRTEEHKGKGRTEFRYGTFRRTIALPVGAKEDSVNAHYQDGILKITVAIGEPTEPGTQVPITTGANGRQKVKA